MKSLLFRCISILGIGAVIGLGGNLLTAVISGGSILESLSNFKNSIILGVLGVLFVWLMFKLIKR